MKVNLLCLPFAGGNRHSLRFFRDTLPPNIVYRSLEYPGRGSRIKEPAITDIHQLLDDVFQHSRQFTEEPYAIYGHSFGAMMAYLFTRRIYSTGMPQPLHLFVSGLDAPSNVGKKQPYHLLPKQEFIGKIRALGGLPDEILNDTEMLDFFLPMLRSDFQAFETYQYEPHFPMNIPLTVMTGASENLKKENLMKWQTETLQHVQFFRFPGGHFFIYDNAKEISDIISGSLVHAMANRLVK